MTEGDDPFTPLQIAGTIDFDKRPRSRIGDLNHARISVEVFAKGFGGNRFSAGKDDLDIVRRRHWPSRAPPSAQGRQG